MNNSEVITPANQSLLESVKEKITSNQVFDKVIESKGLIMDAIIYGGIGFLSGYFLKKYSNVVIILILFVTGLIALQQLELITLVIHWDTIYQTLGFSSAIKVISDNFFVLFTEWARANMHIVVSWIVGFLSGLKVA